MNNQRFCLQHKLPIENICETCKQLICVACFEEHSTKKCKYPIFILTYAKKEMLSKMKLEKEKYKDKVNKERNEFCIILQEVKEHFNELMEKIKALMKHFSDVLKLLNYHKESLYNNSGELLDCEYKQLKEAIANKNIPYIIDKITKKNEIIEITKDCRIELLKNLDKITQKVMKNKTI